MLWKWTSGRQKTGYEKLLLIVTHWPIPFDVYVLRFREGVCIPPHVDQVEVGRHYRLNIVLKQAELGGEFLCDKPIYTSNRIKFFRPDVSEHSVSRVERGTRYLLSIGWVKKE